MSLFDWIAACLAAALLIFVLVLAVKQALSPTQLKVDEEDDEEEEADEKEDSGVWKVDDNGIHDFTGTHGDEGEGPIKVVDPYTGEVVRRCKNYDEARAWIIIETVNNAKGRMVMFNVEDERED